MTKKEKLDTDLKFEIVQSDAKREILNKNLQIEALKTKMDEVLWK